jgi:hypothetical protein
VDKGKGERAGRKPISDEVRLATVTRTVKERPKNERADLKRSRSVLGCSTQLRRA